MTAELKSQTTKVFAPHHTYIILQRRHRSSPHMFGPERGAGCLAKMYLACPLDVFCTTGHPASLAPTPPRKVAAFFPRRISQWPHPAPSDLARLLTKDLAGSGLISGNLDESGLISGNLDESGGISWYFVDDDDVGDIKGACAFVRRRNLYSGPLYPLDMQS